MDEVVTAKASGAGVVDVGEGEGVCVVEALCAGDEVDEEGVLDVDSGRVLDGVVLVVAGGVVTSGGLEVVVGL